MALFEWSTSLGAEYSPARHRLGSDALKGTWGRTPSSDYLVSSHQMAHGLGPFFTPVGVSLASQMLSVPRRGEKSWPEGPAPRKMDKGQYPQVW